MPFYIIATDHTHCSSGSVKIWSAHDSTPDNEGIVLVCKDGTWYPMYGYSDCRAFELACISAGYTQLDCKLIHYAQYKIKIISIRIERCT